MQNATLSAGNQFVQVHCPDISSFELFSNCGIMILTK